MKTKEMRKVFALLLLTVLSATAVQAAPRSKAQMKEAARQAIMQHRAHRHLAPMSAPVKVLHSTEELDIIGYEEGGFAVVAADDVFPAVMGVSAAPYSGGKNPNFQWWLEATRQAARQAARQQAPLHVTTPDVSKYPEDVPSMVTSKWDQTAPYNNMCPIWQGSARCLTGCVATAMAQVLNYHQSPEHGQGQRTIYYPHNNHNGEAVTADFENDYYDWMNMLDVYRSGSYSGEQADAVALLMRDCGVAADMEYGGPSDGSGAYSTDAAEGMRRYFGFDEAECLDRSSFTESRWMDIIYRELSENGPLYYAGASWTSGGHAFVFDGYNAQGQVSVNWGWSGDDDGYFYVSQLNPSGYDFNMQQDMIIGIKSSRHSLLRTETVVLTEAGSLQEILEQGDTIENSKVGTLTVEGPINDADLAYLRQLAGIDSLGQPTEGRLRLLDLTKATLKDNLLPDSAFAGCVMLNRLRLPETLKAVGKCAMAGCSSLMELRVVTKSVPELKGPGVFDGLPFGSARLYVYSGLKTKYAQTAQWKDFGEKNIFQVGTSVKARNTIRYYGEENPAFTYTVTGTKIEGEPRLSCDATQWSPAGRYPIHVTAGSVENAEAVNFIDGYLIVRKVVGAEARVQDATRQEGEANPDFSMTYSGLLSHDKAIAWLTEPKFVTAATEKSPVGVYTVYASGGEAESYEVTFLPGKLTVTPAPVIDAISDVEADRTTTPAYNLQGQRIAAPVRGIYVQGGKKRLGSTSSTTVH